MRRLRVFLVTVAVAVVWGCAASESREVARGLHAQGYSDGELAFATEQAWYELGREGWGASPAMLEGESPSEAAKGRIKAALRTATTGAGGGRRTLHGNAFAGRR